MFSLTCKGLWAHKLRFGLTGAAIVLGVAFLAGTLVLSDTLEQSFDRVFDSPTGADVIVRRGGALEGELATTRGRVDAAVVGVLDRLPGVARARGSVHAVTQLVLDDGRTTPVEGFGVVAGSNWIDDEQLNPFELASGRAPRSEGEAVLDAATLDAQGWQVGDQVQVLGGTGAHTLTVVGAARHRTLGAAPGTALVATTDHTAQELFAQPGRYDQVLVAAAPGVTVAELVDRIDASVAAPAGELEVVTGDQDRADQRADVRESLAFFDQFLVTFAFIALFVATFIIHNTFSILVAQRTRALAMLRAIGARRSQVLSSVLIESAVVGVVAAIVGLAAGIGLSLGLRALLEGSGLELPDGPLVVTRATVVTVLAVGVGVTVVSALAPAVRAGRLAPMAALRDQAVDAAGASRRRMATGLVLTGAGSVSLTAGLRASDQDGLVAIGLGAVGVVLGVYTLGPVLVRPAMALLGLPTRLLGVTGTYARQSAGRNARRTMATASSLMVGVGLVGFITIFAASTKDSVASAIQASFRADFVVESGVMSRGFAPAIEDDLAGVPEVAALSPVRLGQADVDGSVTDVMGVDPDRVDDFYDLGVSAGSLEGLADGGVAVAATKARDEGLVVGDQVQVTFAEGRALTREIAAVFDANAVGGEATWLMDLATFDGHVTDRFDRRVFVALHDDASVPEARAGLEAVLRTWPGAQLQDQAAFEQAITAQIDQLLNLIYGLLALAVVISLIGITNTLTLAVHERTRELGLLRAVGMQRRQLRRAVRWEAVLVAVFGSVLGAGLATAAAWSVVRALADQGVTHFTLPVGALGAILALAVAAAVGAAAGPARRAARLDVLAALAHQ